MTMDEWLREVEAARREPPPPIGDWLGMLLLIVVLVVAIDAVTFYGLYLLGRALHDAIFG